MSFGGKPVVADSPLGLTLRQTGALASGFRVVDVKRASRDETYTLVAGKTREARDRCEEMTVSLERAGDKPVRLDVVFRAFDDGAALRYVLPQQPGLDTRSRCSPRTPRFRFLADHKAWALVPRVVHDEQRARVRAGAAPRDQAGVDRGPAADDRAGDGFVVALAEANLRELVRACTSPASRAATTRATRRSSRSSRRCRRSPTSWSAARCRCSSPWRVLMLGAKPGDLVESTILTSLADPNEIGDTSWIKPGKVRGTGGTGRAWGRRSRTRRSRSA